MDGTKPNVAPERRETMGYKRNRTETLTLRLTPEEKQMLKTKAAVQNRTLTDYILLSALEYSNARRFRSI